MAQLTQYDTARIVALAGRFNMEPAAVLAVVDVESNGRTGTMVNGRFEPMIRFEGHYFDRRLNVEKRAEARKKGLASPKAGEIRNPTIQADRYRLLERARAIDEDAALESTSWGVGQVMGAHWEALGYASVAALVDTARSGVEGQVQIMLDFIKANNLQKHLANRDWAAFARRYNGPAYRTNRYDTKLEAAFRRHFAQRENDGTLRLGSAGPKVAHWQRQLIALGFTLQADGLFGPLTQAATREAQLKYGLKPDGIAGSQTRTRIHHVLTHGNRFPQPLTGFAPWIKVLQNKSLAWLRRK